MLSKRYLFGDISCAGTLDVPKARQARGNRKGQQNNNRTIGQSDRREYPRNRRSNPKRYRKSRRTGPDTEYKTVMNLNNRIPKAIREHKCGA